MAKWKCEICLISDEDHDCNGGTMDMQTYLQEQADSEWERTSQETDGHLRE